MNTTRSTRRFLLAIFILIAAVIACRCDSTGVTNLACLQAAYTVDVFNGVGFNVAGADACTEAIYAACPEPQANNPDAFAAYQTCLDAAATSWKNGLPMPPANYPTNLTLPDGGQTLLTSPDQPQDENANSNPVSVNCAPFALLAPNDGLPNGSVMLIWDTPTPHLGLIYRISYFAENGVFLTSFISPTTGFVSADVSQGAIGGAYQITIVIDALRAGTQNVVCSTSRTYLREANAPAAQSNVQQPPMPTALPTLPVPR